MCRLFGFRAIVNSTVHNSLVAADNALVDQSVRHPDGWGVAYYIEQSPHLIKSVATAQTDQLFQRVSGVVSSQTLIAHLRKATVGAQTILNTHPFQYGKWTFAHNGNIKNFGAVRAGLLNHVAPVLQRFILGDTDSEVLFYLILTQIAARVSLNRHSVDIETVQEAIHRSIELVCSEAGPMHESDNGPNTENYLTFILSNGSTIVAHQGGKHLYYSTYKSSCPVRSTCPFFAHECENPTERGYVNHVLFSSEQIEGENVWIPMKLGQMVGLDSRMLLRTS